MPVTLNPFSGQLILIPASSGGGSSIGGTVTGSTPFTILSTDGSSNLSQIGPLTNGQIIIGRTGNSSVAASLTGTANQITVTPGSGSITLSLPQSIALTSSPTFNNLNLNGSSSGSISIKTQANSGTFNFNLPITAGTAGQLLVSQAGGSNAMTWVTPNTAIVLPDTAIPYGDSGLSSDTTNLYWNKTTKQLAVGVAGAGSILASGYTTLGAGTNGYSFQIYNGIVGTLPTNNNSIIISASDVGKISFQNNVSSVFYEWANMRGGASYGYGRLTLGSTLGFSAYYGILDLLDQNNYFAVSLKTPSADAPYNFNLPANAGTTGQFLTSGAGGTSSMTWSTISIGSLDAQTSNANGAAFVSNAISLQSADATHPGLVNTTTQTFAGLKTFNTSINVPTGQTYQLNSQKAIQAITANNTWYFGNAGNLTGTGVQNTGAGSLSLSQLTTGAGNTAFGYAAGFVSSPALATPTNCTFLGRQATTDGGNYTNSTGLGFGSLVYASNQMVFGDTNITDNQLTGTITTTDSLNLANPQTTLTGSAGTAVCSEPFRGSSYKKIIVYLNGYTDTSTQTYTFPTAFSHTPYVYGLTAGVSGATVTTTSVKFTVTAQTGFVFLEGY